jgi:hypothetical protein
MEEALASSYNEYIELLLKPLSEDENRSTTGHETYEHFLNRHLKENLVNSNSPWYILDDKRHQLCEYVAGKLVEFVELEKLNAVFKYTKDQVDADRATAIKAGLHSPHG